MIATLNLFEIIGIGAAAGCVLLLIWNIMLEMRFRKLLQGADGKNLESHIAAIVKDYEMFTDSKKEITDRLNNIDTRVKGSVRGIGIVRFNPFAGSGTSKPSFAAAFVSEDGRGVIISTLHARESVSIFSKNIIDFKSENELTAEETEALVKAKDSLHT